MKKIFLILVVLGSFTFYSCEETTEIIQDGEINDLKTFTSTNQMKLFLSEAYDRIMGAAAASTLNEIGVSSILTDEVGVGRNGIATDMYRYNVNITNGYSSQIWLDNYTVINYCNRLIRGSSLVSPVNSADAIVYNDIIAQARALRAYSYMQLLTFFSPDLKNNNALGVVLLDRVPTILEKLQRSNNGACFALIESDLNFADDNIQTSTQTRPWTYVSKSMINALRARMYAYRGQYTLAENFANIAMSTSGVSLTNGTTYTTSAAFYGTVSNNAYKQMFQDVVRGEVIWSVGRSLGKQSIVSTYFVNASNVAGISTWDMGRNLFNILDNNGAPWDIRRRVNIDPTAVIDPNYLTSTNYTFSDCLALDKYSGIAGAQLVNDIKAFRISEMLLIRAEARAAANDLPGVATILKTIRDSRSYTGARPLPVYSNVTEAWADILLERRVELCYEGHRLIDLKRLGALAGQGLDRNTRDVDFYNISVTNLPLTDYRFTLPIPQNEISGNPTIQQNPGY